MDLAVLFQVGPLMSDADKLSLIFPRLGICPTVALGEALETNIRRRNLLAAPLDGELVS